MAILNRQALYRVIQQSATPSLSAFVTLGLANGERPPATRLREALQAPAFDEQWDTMGTLSDRQALLAPVLGLVNSEVFWTETQGGLAVFWGSGVFRYYLLPWRFSDSVHVGERFHVRPLIPLLAGDGHYWTLVLGSRRIRLLLASEQLARDVDARDLPVALTDLMSFDPERRTWTFRSPGSGRRALPNLLASLTGLVPDNQLSERRRARFLREVDRAILRLIGTRRRPLVLVGEPDLVATYQAQSTYPKLLVVRSDSPDDLGADALHRLSWDVTAPVLRRERTSSRKQVLQSLSSDDDATRLAQIQTAAAQGRVTDLFVQLRDGPDSERIDRVVLKTYLHGGRVYLARSGELPEDTAMAACIREHSSDATESTERTTPVISGEQSQPGA